MIFEVAAATTTAAAAADQRDVVAVTRGRLDVLDMLPPGAPGIAAVGAIFVSYKRYMRAPHRDVLACRGLAQRGKLRTEHRALNFIARQGDNGIVWTVLSFWRATT